MYMFHDAFFLMKSVEGRWRILLLQKEATMENTPTRTAYNVSKPS